MLRFIPPLTKWALGVFLMMTALTVFLLLNQPKANYVKTTAVIVDIVEEETYDSEEGRRIDYTYYIDYTAGGQEFKHVLLDFSSGNYTLGQEVEIYYDPDDPKVFRSKTGRAAIYTGILAFAALVMAVFTFLRKR